MSAKGEKYTSKAAMKKHESKESPAKKAAEKHPGFKAVAKKIAKKQGVSMQSASAILAAGARKASKSAIKANPRLKKVTMVKKAGKK
jgi:hypothetical protein